MLTFPEISASPQSVTVVIIMFKRIGMYCVYGYEITSYCAHFMRDVLFCEFVHITLQYRCMYFLLTAGDAEQPSIVGKHRHASCVH